MAYTGLPNTGPYDVNQRKYGDGTNSSIGPQINDSWFERKALSEIAKESYFSNMASVKQMPRHYGKKIEQYHYLPILDDRNINDQGIDATGVATQMGVTIQVAWAGAGNVTLKPGQMHGHTVKGEGADAGAALTDAQTKALDIFKMLGFFDTDYATSKAAAEAAGWFVDESAAYPVTGNLYGSSKDVGTISGKFPVLSEHGGRVNRVGMRRIVIESHLEKFGLTDVALAA